MLLGGTDFPSIVQNIVDLINLVIEVLIPLALVIFFWGLVRYVYKSDDAHERTEGRETIIWSLIVLFILFSLWGILALLRVSFGFDAGPTTTTTAPTFTGVGSSPM